jgi:hypothetical protein
MRHFVAFLLPSLLLAACGGDPESDAAGADAGPEMQDSGPSDDPLDPGPGEGVRYFSERSDDADYLFDDSELRSYELVLAPEDLASIDADPAAEEYVEGTLKFEDMEIGPVGIRYKGSIGAWFGCVGNMNFANPGGPKICDKLSLKVKVDWPSDDQRFFGLKKLQFHSMKNDDSMMRERLAYQTFRELGVPAPRAVHARLSINGEYQGVFLLVEVIDGRFTRSRFDDGEGNLYKELWPIDNQGNPRSAQAMATTLSTNEDALAMGTASTERMERFAQAMAGAEPADRLQVVADWMDVDLSMRYIAVDRALLNDDGVYHWYCGIDSSGGCAPHNFFWYEEQGSDRLYLVPWDMDISMTLVNPITTLFVPWDETSHDCAAYQNPTQFALGIRDAACDPILGSFAELGERFDEHSATLLDGPFSQAEVEQDIDRWSAQIRDAVAEADASRPLAISLAEVQGGVASLKSDLAEMRRRVGMRLGREP